MSSFCLNSRTLVSEAVEYLANNLFVKELCPPLTSWIYMWRQLIRTSEIIQQTYAFSANLIERMTIHKNQGPEVKNLKCLANSCTFCWNIWSLEMLFLVSCNGRKRWRGLACVAVEEHQKINCFSKGTALLSCWV
jgi:hypothetical protein